MSGQNSSVHEKALEGSSREKKQSGGEVLLVPGNVPACLNGNSQTSQGITPGTLQTPAIAAELPDVLPASGSLPYLMEDGDCDF